MAAAALIAVVSPVAYVGMIGVQVLANPIVVVINSRSAEPLTLSVRMSRGRPLWEGRLKPGGTARGAMKIPGDSELLVNCRPPEGVARDHRYGYFTSGDDKRVTVTVRSCEDIVFAQRDLLLP